MAPAGDIAGTEAPGVVPEEGDIAPPGTVVPPERGEEGGVAPLGVEVPGVVDGEVAPVGEVVGVDDPGVPEAGDVAVPGPEVPGVPE